MMNRAIIDVDGVLVDMHTKMLDIYNHENGTSMVKTDIIQWDLSPELMAIFRRKGFFINLPLMPNAKDFLYALRELCPVTIATSASNIPNIARDKLEWAHTYIPEFASDFCITERKNIFDATILLDDYERHVLNFNGSLPLLMDQPWNVTAKVLPDFRVDTLADALYKINRYIKTGLRV